MPDETPVPTPSPSPSPSPSSGADAESCTVDTIAKATIENINLFTMDDEDNLYYVDQSTNKVMKVNVATKQKEEIMDISAVKIESDAADYWDFVIENLYYDTHGDTLLAKGSYTQMNGRGEQMGGVYELPGMNQLSNRMYSGNMIGMLSNGSYVTSRFELAFNGSYEGFLHTLDSDFSETEAQGASQGWGAAYTIEQSEADIVFIANNYSDFYLYKYDYSSLKQMFKISTCNAAAVKGNQVVAFVGIHIINIYNLSGKMIKELSADDIKVLDMTPLRLDSVSRELLISRNGEIVFYDTSAKAFRVLSMCE